MDGWSFAPPIFASRTTPAWNGGTIALIAAVALTAIAAVLGFDVQAPGVTALACIVLLIGGLPHGSFDIEFILRRDASGQTAIGRALLSYLLLAALMLALWLVEPGFALLAFLLTATAHFAEDWQSNAGPDDAPSDGFLAHGMALSILAAPALTHHALLEAIFSTLTTPGAAATAAGLLFLIAPIACCVGAAGALSAWSKGNAELGARWLASIVAMLALPPVVGFMLFFTLAHSPPHFAAGLQRLRANHANWLQLVAGITVAALGLAGLLVELVPQEGLGEQAMVVTFITFSILTVPHMFAPNLSDWLRRHLSFTST